MAHNTSEWRHRHAISCSIMVSPPWMERCWTLPATPSCVNDEKVPFSRGTAEIEWLQKSFCHVNIHASRRDSLHGAIRAVNYSPWCVVSALECAVPVVHKHFISSLAENSSDWKHICQAFPLLSSFVSEHAAWTQRGSNLRRQLSALVSSTFRSSFRRTPRCARA